MTVPVNGIKSVILLRTPKIMLISLALFVSLMAQPLHMVMNAGTIANVQRQAREPQEEGKAIPKLKGCLVSQ